MSRHDERIDSMVGGSGSCCRREEEGCSRGAHCWEESSEECRLSSSAPPRPSAVNTPNFTDGDIAVRSFPNQSHLPFPCPLVEADLNLKPIRSFYLTKPIIPIHLPERLSAQLVFLTAYLSISGLRHISC